MIKHSVRFFAAASIVSIGLLGLPAHGDAETTHTLAQKGQAKGQATGQDKAKGRDNGKVSTGPTKVVVVDRDGHHRVVREYVTRGSLPPGLAKRKPLPPGLARQLREQGELPPGLQPYFTPVPQEIDVRFPALPAYYHRYFAGDDFVVVDTRTNRIVLLIRDLLR